MSPDAETFVYRLHGKLLRFISDRAEQPFQGLAAAGGYWCNAGRISNGDARKLRDLDIAYYWIRHTSIVKCDGFFDQVVGLLTNDLATEPDACRQARPHEAHTHNAHCTHDSHKTSWGTTQWTWEASSGHTLDIDAMGTLLTHESCQRRQTPFKTTSVADSSSPYIIDQFAQAAEKFRAEETAKRATSPPRKKARGDDDREDTLDVDHDAPHLYNSQSAEIPDDILEIMKEAEAFGRTFKTYRFVNMSAGAATDVKNDHTNDISTGNAHLWRCARSAAL